MTETRKITDTRTRILVAALLLFNEKGEPNTSTNEIADEVDISPGNLHYHFRRKSDLINALLEEFQADIRRVLEPPSGDSESLDDFWLFLHLLLETIAAYGFLLRDLETLSAQYPKVRHTLKLFAKSLAVVIQLHLKGMREAGILVFEGRDVETISRNIVVIALFSDRFDALLELDESSDASAVRVAHSVLIALLPYSKPDSISKISRIADRYR